MPENKSTENTSNESVTIEGLSDIAEAVKTKKTKSKPFLVKLRNSFFTGVVIAMPLAITGYLTWWFIGLFDRWLKPLIPAKYNPDTYLPIDLPGTGLIMALLALTVLGAAAANLFGRSIIATSERFLDRMPIVRNVYKALKQIFETALTTNSKSFSKVALIEYPRKDIYAIAFVSTKTTGEIAHRSPNKEKLLSVFLPTTPNPTSGFLLFVPEKDVQILDMNVEQAAKLVISAGLVTPEFEAKTKRKSKPKANRTKKVPALSKKQAQSLKKANQPAKA